MNSSNRRSHSWAGVTDPLWYKDAIVYQLHVKAFGDSSQDGIGDFRGLIQRLDYLQELGVDTLWLMPFYPSPLRDDGYDISDYQNIHPDYGTLTDFRAFVHAAHARNLKIVTELVINHSSDQHPWFQAARRAPPGSRERAFYVWNDDDQKFPETRIIFTDTETSNWAWDPMAQQYYWHRFFSHQPDLNHNNPAVVKAVIKVMRFWLDLGVDGLRLDAIPYLCVRAGTANENLPETHAVIRQMRAVVDTHYHGRMFLAEANQWPEDVRDYFGDGDECHMAYHFPLMPRMFMAIAQEDRYPIVEILGQTPDIPDPCQWAIFLRNHDELTLEMVTDRERDYMYRTYAADPRMRVNVGIRRRLAPLLDNDSSKIRLMKSLLLSMPGTPILYYGDEIGMGDNIYLGDRNGVRTPMQWSSDRNAGFSRVDPQRLYLPPIMDPIYGYPAVNVEAQQREPASLLNWMKRLIAVRRTSRAFGRGRLELLQPGNRKILAYVRTFADDLVLCVANLSRSAQPVELDLARYKGLVPVEMLGQTAFPPIGEIPYLLTLPRYGFYWFRLSRTAPPAWHEDTQPGLELRVLVLFQGWKSFFPDQVEPSRRTLAETLREKLVRDVLPDFLPTQRWFAGKGDRIERVEFNPYAVWAEQTEWVLARIRVWLADRPEPQDYGSPLALAWEDDGEEKLRSLWPYALARVRARAKMGLLYDAFANEIFGQSLVKMIACNAHISLGSGGLRFSATRAFASLAGENPERLPIQRLARDSSNTTLNIGDRMLLKGYRRLQPGINPELEMGRFLTDVVGFPQAAPLAGSLEYEDQDGTLTTLALLQGFVANQGDAWSYTQDYLKRFLDDCRQPPEEAQATGEMLHAPYLLFAATLGRRTGELHQALAQVTGDPAFDPEPITAADMTDWLDQIREEVKTTFERLEQFRHRLPEPTRSLAERALESWGTAAARAAPGAARTPQAMKTRYHGDYHLGQVLVAKDDVIIIDFEGEPTRPLAARRGKHSPLRDVVGMLRSFNYAAHAALRQATTDGTRDQVVLLPQVSVWEQQTRAAFLDGYAQAAGDGPGYPTDPDQIQMLLELFTLEKACYELRYELDNRPDWVAIPLGGLAAVKAFVL
ncbi:MAG: maltose alpha-D-glucosyltransferase [Candidatus Competibacter sp.]|nr:maltose alpha-D-glucosyltransferase [Candidatus Competibacter sp.]MDG4604946.1 maltose alpha-D-glucosyltransferase [Candidatus Contendobacter sp.]HRD49092.1 maltose alpha-D-glucosyltransferase [Candidatus Contendobacter sp.]